MGFDETRLIFDPFDGLAQAKLLAVFALHGSALTLLLMLARSQPASTLGRMRVVSGPSPTWLVLGLVLAVMLTAVSLVAGQTAGLGTLLILTAAVLTLYVIEFSILLSNGFFKNLFDEALQPEIRLFICFVVMTNAGYFALMFLKDMLLSDNLGG